MPKSVPLILMGGIAVLFLSAVSGALIHARELAPAAEESALPSLGVVPDFTFTDQNDARFSNNEKLAGNIWIANFFFTSCQGPCPVQTSNLAKLTREFSSNPRVHFVSVSVDPDRDTAAALRAYGARFGAHFLTWHFLRGSLSEVAGLSNDAFKLGSPGDPTFHSTRFVLVDQQERIRGYYAGTEESDLTRLSNDIKALLRETSQG